MMFTSSDMDNDLQANFSCAIRYHCGFWFKSCSVVRLTGIYGENTTDPVEGNLRFNQGIIWFSWYGSYQVHPNYADMKIRP